MISPHTFSGRTARASSDSTGPWWMGELSPKTRRRYAATQRLRRILGERKYRQYLDEAARRRHPLADAMDMEEEHGVFVLAAEEGSE